ncbi:MAG TPA: hypothetical protein VLY04_17160 [Bryobacteraceae bacterium]|nr:hypothetical protein [Bryobacteraceae bacterium]
MDMTETELEAPPKNCKDCKNWAEIKERFRISTLLNTAIEHFESKLTAKDFKPTIAEFLKLLQMEKELEDQGSDKEIQVTWVGPTVKSKEEK